MRRVAPGAVEAGQGGVEEAEQIPAAGVLAVDVVERLPPGVRRLPDLHVRGRRSERVTYLPRLRPVVVAPGCQYRVRTDVDDREHRRRDEQPDEALPTP